MKSFALSIKGGAGLGFGAIGVIRFIQENNLVPKLVAGSSSGAIVAAQYALGLNWQQMIENVKGYKFFNLMSPQAIFKNGALVDYDKYRSELASKYGEVHFSDLKTPLIIFASDPYLYKKVFITKGNVIDALMASSGYPPIFPGGYVEQYHNRLLFDGDLIPGYSANKIRKEGADVVIGIKHHEPSMKFIHWDFLSKARLPIFLPSRSLEKMADGENHPDMEIRFNPGAWSRFNFDHVDKVAENGYKQTLRMKGKIFKLLEV